eukprot:gene4057-6476_t
MKLLQVVGSTVDIDEFSKHLTTQALGRVLNYQDKDKLFHPIIFSTTKVPSTMIIAQDELKDQGRYAHGHGFLSEEQTAGIGRRGRDWKSSFAGNLYFSFIWAPSTETVKELISEMYKLNFAISIATVKAAAAVGVNEARIKWPNDVWIGERKLSGMLVNFDGKNGAVVGVGVNVNEKLIPYDHKLSAISLADVAKGEVNRELVLASFCNELENVMQKPMEEILELYIKYDMLQGRTVRVYHKSRGVDDEKDYNARVLGYSSGGNLIVERLDSASKVSLSGWFLRLS